MSSETNFAQSNVVQAGDAGHLNELTSTPIGSVQPHTGFYEGKRIVYDRKIQCVKRLDQVERRRGTPGPKRKIDISSLSGYDTTQIMGSHIQGDTTGLRQISPPQRAVAVVNTAQNGVSHRLSQQTSQIPSNRHSQPAGYNVNPFQHNIPDNSNNGGHYQTHHQEEQQTQPDQYFGNPAKDQGHQDYLYYQPENEEQSPGTDILDEKDAVIEELTSQVAHLIEENKSLGYENEGLQQQLDEHLQQLHQGQLTETQFHEQMSQQQTLLDQQQSHIERIEATNAAQALQIEQQQTLYDQLQQHADQQGGDNDSSSEALMTLIQNLRSENDNLRDNLHTQETANEQIINLEQAISKRDESHKVLEERLEELNIINSNLHEYLGRLLAKLNENADAEAEAKGQGQVEVENHHEEEEENIEFVVEGEEAHTGLQQDQGEGSQDQGLYYESNPHQEYDSPEQANETEEEDQDYQEQVTDNYAENIDNQEEYGEEEAYDN